MFKRVDERIAKHGELTQDDIEEEIQKYRKEKAAKAKNTEIDKLKETKETKKEELG